MLNVMTFLPSNFGRYVSQNDYNMDDSNDIIKERTQTTTSNIPSLMSLTITPPIMTTNIQQKPIITSSIIKENIEPLPFPQHSPGPIQRPNKLSYSSITQFSSFIDDTPQSPSTPDVLIQINHLLDHQNSITTIPSTPNVLNSDISTPNVPWTPFSSTEWSSWSNSNVSLTTQMQNPFAQQQISKEESSVWPSALGTTTSSSSSSNTRIQNTSEWNELFSSDVPSTIETTKSTNNSWLKFLPLSDSPSNKQENETNNPFWNSINLNDEWSKTPSDENNNDNDQSRWDFAR